MTDITFILLNEVKNKLEQSKRLSKFNEYFYFSFN